MSVTKLQTQKADTYEHHTEIGGLVVGVHPMTEKTEVKRVFKVNLLNNGLLPILLVAENHNASSSFIIAKEKVVVLNEATGIANTSQTKDVAAGTAATGATLAIIGAGGGMGLIGLKLASDATVIQHNLADKEFYSRTIGPGQKAEGFIYFQFPKETPPSGAYHVVLQIKNSATGEVTPFDFKVNLAPAKP